MHRIDRFLDIRRDPHSDELLARGGDPEAHSILQRVGFVAVVRVHETYHRVPTGMVEDVCHLRRDAAETRTCTNQKSI